MPRFSRLRSSILEEFARQQRFAPSRALRRQVERAEALIDEIDPAAAYPEDWLVFRLTGYRAEIESPAALPGEALLADLPAMVERLSDGAGYTTDELQSNSLSPDALARRWRISRRTLERYRRLGLAGRRTRSARGRVCLRFITHHVEAFERRRAELLDRPAPPPRVSDEERTRLHRTAMRLNGVHGATLTGAAKLIAKRHGRAPETVRRAVRQADKENAEPVFQERRGLSTPARQAVLDALTYGESPTSLAARLGRTRASVHRIANERRAERLRTLDLTVPDAAAAMEGQRLLRLLEPASVRVLTRPAHAGDGATFAMDARGAEAGTARIEREWAAAYHALRALAARAIGTLPSFNPPAASLDGVETMLRWAAQLKIELVHSQRGLVLRSIEERTGRAFEALDPRMMVELHERGFRAAIDAVAKFDPFQHGGRGPGRLAAPVALELGRALAAGEPRSAPIGSAARRAASAAPRLVDWTRRVAPWQAWLDPPLALTTALEHAANQVQNAVRWRYGLAGSPPVTLAELRRQTGITEARFMGIVRRLIAQRS